MAKHQQGLITSVCHSAGGWHDVHSTAINRISMILYYNRVQYLLKWQARKLGEPLCSGALLCPCLEATMTLFLSRLGPPVCKLHDASADILPEYLANAIRERVVREISILIELPFPKGLLRNRAYCGTLHFVSYMSIPSSFFSVLLTHMSDTIIGQCKYVHRGAKWLRSRETEICCRC